MTATPPPPDRAWAGHVAFPRSPADLRSTTNCPACFTPLSSVVCSRCGLNLAHPAAVELATASAAVADALDARLDIIGRIRRETAEASAVPAAVSQSTVAAATAAEPLVAEAPVTTTAPAPAATPSAAVAPPPLGAAQPEGSRRSGIQIALIVVGISLLSVFAAFGLVYAFVTFGQVVRLSIIAAGTIATMVAAAVLARRGLRSTGEGVAVLASVMLLLDAWALQLNDPAGLGAAPERQYWGFSLLIVGGAIAVWAQLGRLVAPALVAAALLPVGAGLITGHLTSVVLATIDGADVLAGALAVIIVGAGTALVVPREPAALRTVARIIGQVLGAAAAVVALVSLAFVHPESRWAPVVGGLALALAVGLHVAVLQRTPSRSRALDRLTAGAIGAGAAIAAIAGASISALRFDQDRVVVSAPLLAAVLVAVVAEQLWRRAGAGTVHRTAFASATVSAAVQVVVAAAIAGIVGSSAFVEAAARSFAVVPLSPSAAVAEPEAATLAALGALSLALGLIALSWASLRVLIARARALTLIVGVVIVAAVPLLGPWWLVMLVYALLAVGGALSLHLGSRAHSADRRRAVLALGAVLAVGSALGAFAIAWAVSRAWWIGLVVVLVTIMTARTATPHVALRATGLAVAAGLTLGSSGALASDLTVAVPSAPVSTAATMLVMSAVIIVATQLGQLTRAERLATQSVALLAAAVASALEPEPLLGTIVGFGSLVAALTVVIARRARASVPDRWAAAVAAAALPIAVGRGTALVGEQLRLDDAGVASVTVAALIVTAALSLVFLRTDRTTRLVADVSALVVTEAALVVSLVNDSAPHYLPVLFVGIVALLVSIDRDGLFASRSPRRWLGWLAVVHAVGALWIALADIGIDEPEAFTLPVAGLLIAIVAALVRVRRRTGIEPGPTVPPLTFAAALMALVPSALAGAAESPSLDARTIVVALVAVTLILAPLPRATSITATLPGVPTALVGAGTAGLAVLVAVQSWQLSVNGAPLAGVDMLRAALIVIVPTAVAVTARLIVTDTQPTRLVQRIAIVAPLCTAALAAGVLGLSGAVEPVELVSIPLAVGLLALGALHLDSVPAARSWPWLGPGVAALLVPSLLAVDDVGEPLWRTASIALVATAVFLVALLRRLQAPFVISGVVLLVHLLVQSWPLLSLVGRAVEWWLWLGLAGVIVVALAARYERRLQNVRNLAARISQLR